MTTGAVGKDAADDKGNLRRDTNLQYGVVACRAADMFLLASDGVWCVNYAHFAVLQHPCCI